MFVIAGVTGRTGRVVAESLLSRGKRVRVLVRDSANARAWTQRGAEAVAVSLEGPALERALLGASAFYTVLPEDPRISDFHAHRRGMADTIAAAVRANGVPHVVSLSGAAVLPTGNGPAADLYYAERALEASGASLSILRASYFQENVLSALQPAQEAGIYPSFFPSPDTALPTIATRDVGTFATQCLLEPPRKNEIIDLIGPVYSIGEMAEHLGRALGKSLQVVDIPPAAHAETLTRAGLPHGFAKAVADMFACFASGRVSPQGDRMVPGTTRLEELLPQLLRAADIHRISILQSA